MKNASMIHLSEIGEKGLDWLTAKWKEWGPTIVGLMDTFKSNVGDYS
jgi:hypothetical protein